MLKNSDNLTDRFIHLKLSPLIYTKRFFFCFDWLVKSEVLMQLEYTGSSKALCYFDYTTWDEYLINKQHANIHGCW